MQKKKALLFLPFMLSFLLFPGGCAQKEGETVNLPELGFSITLPEGWEVDSQDPYFFYAKKDRQNTFGGINTIPSNGANLMSFVDRQVEAGIEMERVGERLLPGVGGSRAEIVSRTHRGINGMNSVELVMRQEGYHIFTVWMAKGQDIIRVYFHVPEDKFPQTRESLVNAAKSIKLK